MAKAIKKSKLRWASLIYPATQVILKTSGFQESSAAGHCIFVFDTELKNYTIRFLTRDLDPKHMYYSGVTEEIIGTDGKSVTKDKMGTICDRLGLSLQPRLEMNTFDVSEYYTLHYGDEVIAFHKKKISVSITGRSTVYFDDIGEPIEITVKGNPAVSLKAARASWWSEAKNYPAIHWKGDLAVLCIADEINIDVDDDDAA